MNSIITLIQEGLRDYRTKTLKNNPNFAPTQPEVVELIDLYCSDKYRDRAYDELGFLKPFYNIVDTPLQVTANYTDIDVKNIEFYSDTANRFFLWLMEHDFKNWTKETQNCYADGRWMSFGLFLNALVFNWAKYGHLVLKKSNNKLYLMPIQNLSVEPTAENFRNACYIIEKHDYSPYELKQMKWDNIDSALKLAEKGHIFVYEYYGKIPGENNNYFIVAVKPHKLSSDLGEGILLHSDKLDDIPYKDLPFEKMPGRLLGKGIIERLFHAQIYQNKLAYYKARGAHWTSKHIYQTRDETFDKNLTTDVPEGRVLTPLSEIRPVPVEERNLHFYREEESRYDTLVDKKTFTWDVVRGERPPAGITLGQTILQSRAAGGFFRRKQEELGLFLKEVLYDWVLPQFTQERNATHRLSLSGLDEDKLTQIKNMLITLRTNREIVNRLIGNGRVPDPIIYEATKALVAEKIKKERDISIPARFYKKIRPKINITITGEQIDLNARIATIQSVMTIIGQNPTILENPNTRKLFLEMLDLAGISPTRFETSETPEISEVIKETVPRAERGGSVARIPSPVAPGTVEVPRRL